MKRSPPTTRCPGLRVSEGGGNTPGSGYGHIHFTSPLPVAGTFTVSTRNGFRPNPGDMFQVLSYPSATNEFDCLNGLELGSSSHFEGWVE